MKVEKIDDFSTEFAFLANDYPVEVHLDGVAYPTVDHAIQASKTLDAEERELIKNAPTAAAARLLGKSVTLRPAWDEVRDNILSDLLWEKFSHNTDLRAKLLATGDLEIAGGDLGRFLTEIREKIRKSGGGLKFLTKVCTDLEVVLDVIRRSGLPFDVRSAGDGQMIVMKSEFNGNDVVEIRFGKNDDLEAVEAVDYDVPF